jgi:ribose transport system permease protein
MLAVLLILGVGLSIATWTEHAAEGPEAAAALARRLSSEFPPDSQVLVAASAGTNDQSFASTVSRELKSSAFANVHVVQGEPRDARRMLQTLADDGRPLAAIAASPDAAKWLVFADLEKSFPALGSPPIRTPERYSWPTFLKSDNLLNIANQISITAILAIGMTMVILTGGVDLSVGSVIALSAVTCCMLIERWGDTQATTGAMIAASALGVGAGGLAGTTNGLIITRFKVPPFIVTLATMLILRGFVFWMTNSQSISHVPASFGKLGIGSAVGRIPNAAVLMLALYVVAYLILSRTVIGRHLYAVGGNREAAHLSGIRTERVLLYAYVVTGLLAGLGGLVMASQLKGAKPTYGEGYELGVIAAVVVGGTSLSGGEGGILGTLVGTLIIAVIQNGMNLLGVESNLQRVVLGCVILGAVLLDNLKRRG